MKIKCERFIFSFLFLSLSEEAFEIAAFFISAFRQRPVLSPPLDVFKVSRIVLSDLWEGGGGIVASSDIKPGDSLLRVVTESSDRKGSKLSPPPSDKVAAPELSERNTFQ